MPRAERPPPRRRPPCTRIDLRTISVGLLLATRHARSRASRGSLAAGSRGYIAIPRRSPRFAWGPSPGSRVAASLDALHNAKGGASASAPTRNSPSIPTLCVGALAGLSRRGLLGRPTQCQGRSVGLRADSQFPVDPHALRGGPRRALASRPPWTPYTMPRAERRPPRRLAIPRRSPRFAWGPSPGSRVAASLDALYNAKGRASASAPTRNSPSIPTLCVGALAGLSRRGLLGRPIQCQGPSVGLRADSQFPVDPHALR